MSDAMFKITDMQRTVQVQADKLPDLEKRIEKLKKLELIAQEAEAMERDIQKLANQIVWRKVKDQEILYDEMEAKVNKRQTHIGTTAQSLASGSLLNYCISIVWCVYVLFFSL